MSAYTCPYCKSSRKKSTTVRTGDNNHILKSEINYKCGTKLIIEMTSVSEKHWFERASSCKGVGENDRYDQ